MESYDLALRAFTRASDINSNDPILYYNMSLVHIVQLQLDEAEILFEKALKYFGLQKGSSKLQNTINFGLIAPLSLPPTSLNLS